MNISTYSDCLFSSHIPLDKVQPGLFDNVVVGGGWLTQSPIMLRIVEKYGDKYNPYKILATSSKAYWISYAYDDNTIILDYIRNHYNPIAECKIVDKVGIYNIISFSTY